jgi:type II secretory pathway pseudopilin PulG
MEALIALVLLAVLGAILLPTFINSTGKEKLLGTTKEAATQLAKAFTEFSSDNTPTANTRAVDIINNMTIVRQIRIGEGLFTTRNRGVVTTNGTRATVCSETADSTPGTQPCNALTPCVLMNTGGLLQYDANAVFCSTANCVVQNNTNALPFIFDPDGTGPQAGVSLALYFGGRVTTGDFTNITAGTGDFRYGTRNLPVYCDPEYVWAWTGG